MTRQCNLCSLLASFRQRVWIIVWFWTTKSLLFLSQLVNPCTTSVLEFFCAIGCWNAPVPLDNEVLFLSAFLWQLLPNEIHCLFLLESFSLIGQWSPCSSWRRLFVYLFLRAFLNPGRLLDDAKLEDCWTMKPFSSWRRSFPCKSLATEIFVSYWTMKSL